MDPAWAINFVSFSVNILQLCEIIRLIVKETHAGITRCLQKVRYHVSKFHIFVLKKAGNDGNKTQLASVSG